ncbi:hypothetical protein J2W68_002177 [Luteimonas terrae]|uniref:Uncharacterized protein n=1 Tax=Luteimonas terrae TaxID=1530191 RepID=A0ABU1XXE9_9GAMM|nr:hypothetical protein [Luteimonas terrae]
MVARLDTGGSRLHNRFRPDIWATTFRAFTSRIWVCLVQRMDLPCASYFVLALPPVRQSRYLSSYIFHEARALQELWVRFLCARGSKQGCHSQLTIHSSQRRFAAQLNSSVMPQEIDHERFNSRFRAKDRKGLCSERPRGICRHVAGSSIWFNSANLTSLAWPCSRHCCAHSADWRFAVAAYIRTGPEGQWTWASGLTIRSNRARIFAAST